MCEKHFCIRLKEAALVWTREPRWYRTDTTLAIKGRERTAFTFTKAAFYGIYSFTINLSPCCQGDGGGFFLCAICTMKWILSHRLKSWVFSETALKDLPCFHGAPYSINGGSNPAFALISQQICVNIPMIRSEPRANWGQMDAGRRPLVGVENCV